MKTNIVQLALFTTAVLIRQHCGYSQGSFGNLDFESVVPPLPPSGSYQFSITNALPRWTGYIGGVQQATVWYNTITLGDASIGLTGTNSGMGVNPFQGNYFVSLEGGYMPGSETSGVRTAASILQVGTIPGTASSIRFYASNPNITVGFSGQDIPVVLLGSTASYNIYGGDVSIFRGQTGPLRFSSLVPTTTPTILVFLDAISFSNQPVPEPSICTFAFLGTAVLALGCWRRRRCTK